MLNAETAHRRSVAALEMKRNEMEIRIEVEVRELMYVGVVDRIVMRQEQAFGNGVVEGK